MNDSPSPPRSDDPTIGHSDDMPTVGASAAGVARARTPNPENLNAVLEPGTVIAGRYEVQVMLGLGGMGAVYKVHDCEFDRVIALKVIRPDLASNPEILQRFKQEMVLARQITHRNVVRIYDVGEADGVKFLTMEFVVGENLQSILDVRGKLPAADAVDIIRQVSRGLQAAHVQGVIHRDLKPSNIMRDPEGRIVVMDFGLARTAASSGMTQTGAALGTIEYMSPEQALAQELDARSDLFTVGLIFYELLSGKRPFQADSPIASLIKRTQQDAEPLPISEDSVTAALSGVVSKCLQRDRSARYQTAQEILNDLDTIYGRRSGSIAALAAPAARLPWIAAGAVIIVLASALGWFFSHAQVSKPHEAVTVLLADFNNTTSDPVFDGTLEPAFGLALEGASFLNSYNRGQARKIAAQLHEGNTALDEAGARLVAVREGIGVVVSGEIAKAGDGFKVTAKAMAADSGKVIMQSEEKTSSKDGVLKAVGSLAGRIRSALGDSTPESVRRMEAETFTSASLAAAHEYAQAQELRAAGKGEESIQRFLKSVELDPNFGSAYAGAAAMYANVGQRDLATKYYKLAIAHTDRMTEREKLRTRGGYYLAGMDPQKAIQEFSQLAKAYPADTMGHSSLAFAYYLNRDMPRALEEGRRALELYPKNVPYRNNVALYALYAGEFETAIKEGRATLEINPAYLKAYITVALAALAQGKPEITRDMYAKLAKVNTTGASFAGTGEADLAMYEGRLQDAITGLTKAVESDIANNNAGGAAKKFAFRAEAELAMGKKSEAMSSLARAISLNKDSVLIDAARIYVEAGDFSHALPLAQSLGEQFESIPQAYAKIIEGEIQLKQGRSRDAVRVLQESLKLADTWLAHYDLARAHFEAKAFTEADSELDACIRRRGEATDIFLDEQQTIRFFPSVYYYKARVQQDTNNASASDTFRTFLATKTGDSDEPLAADARRRISAR
ncbi:MAG: Serine/threonine-protein kinase PknB [Candidatus Angelobacter sp.]|nr:Serine/threonine-protein kinase PknB [Candidatus Angelobacter sp.]